ncbi:hypothetical protein V2J09_015933 [Rumex salicifolius]
MSSPPHLVLLTTLLPLHPMTQPITLKAQPHQSNLPLPPHHLLLLQRVAGTMVTWSQHNITKPISKLNLNLSFPKPIEPTTISQALKDTD